ncbi:MAG: hypothetical protein EBR02_01110 [Alphaproteobacteria bacterium]|nr:hypothetical protein [Alphaproteobacteria bacterium]
MLLTRFSIILILAAAIAYGGNIARNNILIYNQKVRIGGDVEIADWHPIPVDLTSFLLFLSHDATISRVAETSTPAKHGKIAANVSLKGVDMHYPLYGKLQLKAGTTRHPFFINKKAKIYGAALDKNALKALGLKMGEIFSIGESKFQVTSFIINEPDPATGAMALLPRIIVDAAALSATISYVENQKNILFRCRVRLPTGFSITKLEESLFSQFESPTWGWRSWKNPEF